MNWPLDCCGFGLSMVYYSNRAKIWKISGKSMKCKEGETADMTAKSMKGLKSLKMDIVYMAIEYFITIYAVLVTIINLLNMSGVTEFYSWFMKPTFAGASQLILILLQYGLITANRKNKILEKIRPYFMGIMAAGIVSAGRLPLCLLLLLMTGYFLTSGFQKRYQEAEAALVLLVASVGIEVYSIVALLQDSTAAGLAGGFLESVGPDVLFVLAAVLYGLAVKDPSEEAFLEEAEGQDRNMRPDGEEEEGDRKENEEFSAEEADKTAESVQEDSAENKTAGKWFLKKRTGRKKQRKQEAGWFGKVCRRCREAMELVKSNCGRIVRCAGNALCVVSAGLFLYYGISVGIGARKCTLNQEEVYLLRHCEDASMVLTAAQTDTPGVYQVSFERYEGQNSQKVFFQEVGENAFRIGFVKYGCVLDAGGEAGLCAAPVKAEGTQLWFKEYYEGEGDRKLGRFICVDGTPLCYSGISEAGEVSEVSVRSGSGLNEMFVLERTITDEFSTQMVYRHYDGFMPTILMESVIALLGGWVWLFFVLAAAAVFAIIYLRRVIGDKLAALYAALLVYMIFYESISAIVLLGAAFCIQCYYAYTKKSAARR